jgi:ribonuclease M5
MQKVKEIIVVEGKYDKNTLSQVVDATIIETHGFGIFNDSQKRQLLQHLAATRGLIIMTDSDGAGFLIRNHLKGCIDPKLIKNAYIPDIYGKERRKASASKEGKLGVEGMKPDIILQALRRAGATFEGENGQKKPEPITKLDLYRKGLSGGANSAMLRKKLLKQLNLPERLTADGLLDVLNALMSRDEFLALEIKE